MKKVLITGSASGLGACLAKSAKGRGYSVIGLDKTYCNLGEAAQVSDGGVDVKVACDLSDIDQVREAIREVKNTCRSTGLSLLINNACHFLMRPLGDLYLDSDLIRATTANVIAPLLLTSGLRVEMERADNPMILNISSGSSRGGPFCAHYCMSKGALNSLAYAVNEEFRINGNIRAINFILGTLDTGFSNHEPHLAITPVYGKDPVIDPRKIAETVFDIFMSTDSMDFVDIEIKPNKKFVKR